MRRPQGVGDPGGVRGLFAVGNCQRRHGPVQENQYCGMADGWRHGIQRRSQHKHGIG